MRRRAALLLGPLLLAVLPACGGGEQHRFPDPPPSYEGAAQSHAQLREYSTQDGRRYVTYAVDLLLKDGRMVVVSAGAPKGDRRLDPAAIAGSVRVEAR